MAIIYKQCPKCGSQNSLKIVYGMPGYELFKEAEAGKVRLGGCCIITGNPEYFCKDCENEWNREQAIECVYSKIKTIKAGVGGYSEGYYNVEIDLNNANVRWGWSQGGDRDQEETVHKKMQGNTVKKFIEKLKMVEFLNWKARYVDSEVLDGTQWRVDIVTDAQTIKKYGDNKFPDEWDLFCVEIERLTRRKFR